MFPTQRMHVTAAVVAAPVVAVAVIVSIAGLPGCSSVSTPHASSDVTVRTNIAQPHLLLGRERVLGESIHRCSCHFAVCRAVAEIGDSRRCLKVFPADFGES